ncbi:MAG: polymer-forming cytoskeletal protein [Vicinamibacteria bacterium]
MDAEKGTLIDTDSRFEGTLSGKDARILGRFKGDIEIKGRLVLGEGSVVEAKVVADTAEIAGEFKGEIVAERLTFMEKARVTGTFDAKILSVREGAQMNGSVSAGEGRKPAAPVAPQAKTTVPIPPAKPAAGTPAG